VEETKAPGIALAAVGGIAILLQLVSLVLSAISLAGAAGSGAGTDVLIPGISQAVFGCLGLLFSGFIVFGGIKLMKGESYGICMTAAIFAMLPFCTGACCLLGLPVGIWAIVSMMKVKDQFR
jgi:membrane-bound ClpP family serine protease